MLARCVATLKPPPELTLSQWADRYRMLSAESSAEPGRWHTDKAPYQREIMDAIGDAHIRRVVIMCAAQLGKTELLLNILGYFIFKSITFDNGTEFAAAEGLERSCVNKRLPRTKVYFCHPYSSWERGTNENTNGMIRRRFPKGTNFAAVTNAQIAQAENWINHYPRKILGYKSSEIVFRECLRELGIAA